MLFELVLTLILLAANFFTSILVPIGLPNVSAGFEGGIDAFVSFFPDFPLIPYRALSISFAVLISVFLMTILYKIVRAAVSLLIR